MCHELESGELPDFSNAEVSVGRRGGGGGRTQGGFFSRTLKV